MLKLVVIEDNQPILRSIVKKIKSTGLDIKVVGQAFDGISGLDIIKEHMPNIVFTDVKMPGIDGLELIEKAKKFCPDAIFVIISGYDDFQYAHKALRLNVNDYLLKPVSQSALDELLKNLCNIINSKMKIEQRKLLQEVLKPHSDKALLKDPNLGFKNYLMILICCGNYCNFNINLSNNLNDFWFNINLEEMASDILPANCGLWVYDGYSINEQLLVLGFNDDNKAPIMDFISNLFNKLTNYEASMTFSVSKKVEDFLELSLEYKFTREFTKKFLVFGKPSIIYSSEHKLSESVEFYNYDAQKLTSLIKGKKTQAFFNELKSILSNFEKENYTQLQVLNSLINLANFCNTAFINQYKFNNDFALEIEENISISEDYTMLYNSLLPIFQRLFASFENSTNSSVKDDNTLTLMKNVEDYIQKHFTEPISINDMADMINLNVSYFSRKFKEYKSITPIEYLTKLRIDKAKQLISSSDVMLKDVAEIVGYSNQYYFSKVFKLIVGETPSEYRNKY